MPSCRVEPALCGRGVDLVIESEGEEKFFFPSLSCGIYVIFTKNKLRKICRKKHLFVVLLFGIAALLPLRAQDMALLLMQGDLPYQGTSWSFSGSGQPLQQEEIKENWDKDYCIVSAAHTHRGLVYSHVSQQRLYGAVVFLRCGMA